MKKLVIGIAAVVIVLVAVSASAKPDAPAAVTQATPSAVTADASAPSEATATAEPATAEPTADPTAAVSYKPIVFTVTSGKTTKPFYIGTTAATLSIRNKGGCDMTISSAILYPKGETAIYVGEMIIVQDCEPHETEIYLDAPGDYYLKILSANTETTVTITPHD